METLLILILLFIVLDLAALRWGFDSTEKLESPEWERRWMWAASHHEQYHEHKGEYTRAHRLQSNGHLPARKLPDKQRAWLSIQFSTCTLVSCDKQQSSRERHHVINPIAVIRHHGSMEANQRLTFHQMRGYVCVLSSFAEKRTAGRGQGAFSM